MSTSELAKNHFFQTTDKEVKGPDYSLAELYPNSNAKYESEFIEHLEDLIKNGHLKTDRTGTGTLAKLGNVLRIDISDNKAPLVFFKDVKHKSFTVETDWFLRGDTDISYLKQNGVGIWDEWVIPETATFQEYSETQLEEARKSYQLIFEKPRGWRPPDYANVMSYKDLFNYFRCVYPESYKEWKKKFPTGSNLIQLRNYIMDNLPKGLSSLNNIPNVKLSGGSIGVGAYGSLWRHWEDTRIVELKDAQKFYDRGYSYVADVPLGSNWKKEAGKEQKQFVVIHRNIDQIANVIHGLKTNPHGRRHIVTAWNPGRTEDAVLPPCHSLFSFFVRDLSYKEIVDQLDLQNKATWARSLEIDTAFSTTQPATSDEARHQRRYSLLLEFIEEINTAMAEYDVQPIKKQALSCLLYMRSNDTGLGANFNIPQYALLTQVIAQCVGMATDELVFVAADSHLYLNHVEAIRERLKEPYNPNHQPRFLLDPKLKDIKDFTWKSVRVVNYDQHNSVLSLPIAV